MREYGMSKEEFECVAKAYPAFAKQVKFWTEVIAMRGEDLYASGILEGYAKAMIDGGFVGRARLFIEVAQRIANSKYERIRKVGMKNG